MSETGPDRWFFDTWSRIYDVPVAQRLTYRPVHDTVVREVAAGDHTGTVLDVGCGTGILAARLAESGVSDEVFGCDFSRGMLARAAERTASVGWVQGDAQRLPFGDETMDVVTCTESFHWYPDSGAALTEFRRVLRSGGRLYVALVNTRARAVSEVTRIGFGLIGQPLRWPTLGEMRNKIEAAGLRITHQAKVARFPPGILLPTILTTAVRDA